MEHKIENNVIGATGEVHATIQVVRANTGKVETFEIVGKLDQDQLNALTAQEKQNGSNTQLPSFERGD